mmetsp:Transcript_16833/g.41527  ORF Transcript_16833/g.41527 Transcript_16833/m.41527 type:complete len:269 (+) Transcript_16833:1639-2445(+)
MCDHTPAGTRTLDRSPHGATSRWKNTAPFCSMWIKNWPMWPRLYLLSTVPPKSFDARGRTHTSMVIGLMPSNCSDSLPASFTYVPSEALSDTAQPLGLSGVPPRSLISRTCARVLFTAPAAAVCRPRRPNCVTNREYFARDTSPSLSTNLLPNSGRMACGRCFRSCPNSRDSTRAKWSHVTASLALKCLRHRSVSPSSSSPLTRERPPLSVSVVSARVLGSPPLKTPAAAPSANSAAVTHRSTTPAVNSARTAGGNASRACRAGATRR